jgi:methylated-DNA-[protein]-cysteine S-methyltransferase
MPCSETAIRSSSIRSQALGQPSGLGSKAALVVDLRHAAQASTGDRQPPGEPESRQGTAAGRDFLAGSPRLVAERQDAAVDDAVGAREQTRRMSVPLFDEPIPAPAPFPTPVAAAAATATATAASAATATAAAAAAPSSFPAAIARSPGKPASQHQAVRIDDTSDEVAVASLMTPVGRLGLVVSSVGLAAVGWRDPVQMAGKRPMVDDRGRLAPALDQLARYFAGDLQRFDLELDLRRSSKAQWLVLRTLYDSVPYGASVTYGELAHLSRSGVPARGIGSVMGANPIPIVVPCHRVVAHDGLGGYSGGRTGEGLHTKRWLLTLEGVLEPTLDWPGSR